MRRVGAICAAVFLAACENNGTAGVPLQLVGSAMRSPETDRYQQPSYSPDGSRLSYWTPTSEGAGGWQLWVANADLTGPVKLPVIASQFLGPEAVLWSPDGSRITTYSSQFGAADIVVLPSSGGAVKRVTMGPGIELPLAWYPDGDRISYYATSNANVLSFVVPASTAVSTPAIPGEKRPHGALISPDGAHIVYFISEGSRTTLWVADSVGKNPRQLTTEGFEIFSFPFAPWSPNSKEILYESRRTGTADLWVVPIDGGKARQLTRDVRNDYGGTWSPDGKWIAFLSDRGKQTDVWVVSTAGGDERRVTDNAEIEIPPLRWRPGTAQLTFTTASYKSGVWVLGVEDGKERRLTPDSVKTAWFNVSPDGKNINYVIDHGGGINDLAIVPMDGGPSRIVTAGGGAIGEAYWSRDGAQIAFTSDRGGTTDIWIVDAAGGAPRQLENWPGYEANPRWSGDGKSILFYSDRDSRLGDIWRISPAGGEPMRVTRDGGISAVAATRAGAPGYAVSVTQKGGQYGLALGTDDGKLLPIWMESNVTIVGDFSPSGDSIAAVVEQRDGAMASMILPTKGGKGRVILKPGDAVGAWSKDGVWMQYTMPSGGANDLAILNVATGETRRLTTTPEDERGSEWTPDGKSLVFTRRRSIDRLTTVDLAKLLTPR